jgi:hypothetical protein
MKQRCCEICGQDKGDYGGICEACGSYCCINCFNRSYKSIYIGLCPDCRKGLGNYHILVKYIKKRKQKMNKEEDIIECLYITKE